MNQKKIGQFLKELRDERKLTQEQIAEMLGVTNRSVSRWENGINLPDFDKIMELSRYYDVGVEEILDGQRKTETNREKTEKAIMKAADYKDLEKQRFSRRACGLFIVAIVAFAVYGVLDFAELTATDGYRQIASFAMGIVFGTLLFGAIYTSRYITKIQALKRRLLIKIRRYDCDADIYDDSQNNKSV